MKNTINWAAVLGILFVIAGILNLIYLGSDMLTAFLLPLIFVCGLLGGGQLALN